MPEQFDWTISDAPGIDEPATRPPSRRPIRRTSRKAGLIIAAVIFGTLVAVVAFGAWNEFRIRHDVERVVLSEERAARAGDVDALLDLTDPSDSTLRRMQIKVAVNNQPAPLPSQVLRSLPNTADMISFSATAAGEMRADVTRLFLAPDGSRLAFTLPQFYRFEQSTWKRIAPPADWNTVLTRGGPRADITYLAADQAFIENDLGPHLDDVLQRACTAWACPPAIKLKLQFASSWSLLIAQDQSALPNDEPLLFAFVWSQYWTNQGNTLLLPAPRFAGYPADAASANWLRHAIAVQALAELATRLTVADGVTPSRNAFLIALVTRMSANVGLEPAPSVTSPAPVTGVVSDTADLSRNVNLMWDLSLRDAEGIPLLVLRDATGNLIADDPAGRDRVLRSALAMTNWLLRGQPIDTDYKLLRAIRSAHNQTSWLSQGLAVSPDEAWTRLQVAVWNTRAVSSSEPQFALTCSAAVVLASPSQTIPIIVNYKSGPDYPLSYSPDGKHLLVNTYPDLLLVDLDTGVLTHTPWLDPRQPGQFRGWLSNTAVATLQETSPNTTLSSLQIIDVTNPAHPLPSAGNVANIAAYNLSPDKTQAAVTFAPNPQAPHSLTLAIMPASGGRLKPIDETIRPDLGFDPVIAWSSDSQALAYLHQDPASEMFSLRVADVATGLSHEIWSGRDPGAPAGVYGLIAWSPMGGHIAFALQGVEPPDGPAAWLGIVNADGTGPKLLQRQSAIYTKLAFSGDGRYLATIYYNSRGDSSYAGTIVVYAAADGGQNSWLVNNRDFAWSASGHQLAVLDSGGVEVITDLGSLQRQKLTSDSCSDVAWRPTQ